MSRNNNWLLMMYRKVDCIILTIIINTGKNSTYAQAKIKLFARQHGVLCKAVFAAAFCCLRVKLENKEYHHGGFQQQSPQQIVDRYEHINSLNES